MIRQESVSEAHVQATKGVGATTLLEIMAPLVETRKNRLIDAFVTVAPTLEVLLDVRAQLIEIRRIQKELERVQSTGASAANALRNIAG